MKYNVKAFDASGVCVHSKDWLVLEYATLDHMHWEDLGYTWILCDKFGTILNTNWEKYLEAESIWDVKEVTRNYDYWNKEDDLGFTKAELDILWNDCCGANASVFE